ncbi:MAG: SDR family oxidoreductase, partial [Caulobacteraceae bacterium]
GEVNDVAYAVLYLASDESRFITATELKVDGGTSAA